MNNQYEPPQSDVAGVNRTNDAGITDEMIDAMRGTKPWVLLIGIVLIISAAFMLIGTIGIMIASTVGMAAAEAGPLIGVAVMYGVMGIIYVMMGVYLFKYSSAIGRLLQSVSVIDMEEALQSQRKFWKIAGIITAVMLVLMVLGFIAAIAIPMLQLGGL